jgi:uncharacterized glyoxalase superfamily protein PhnB
MILPTLSVRDLAASLEFYVHKLGFNHDFSLPDPNGQPVFARVSLGDAMLGMTQVYRTVFDTKAVGFMVYIPEEFNLEHYHADVQSRGVSIVEPLGLRYWGDQNFAVHDPDGYVLALSKTVKQLSVKELADGTRQDLLLGDPTTRQS